MTTRILTKRDWSKVEKKKALPQLRHELKLTRRELAKIEWYEERIEKLKRHALYVLNEISKAENREVKTQPKTHQPAE